MIFSNFIRKLVKHGLIFEVGWYDKLENGWKANGSEQYCIQIILANNEYIIPHHDRKALKALWNYIKTY